MKYLPQRNLFFVHIPKNAGMSVRRALSVPGEDGWEPMATDLGLDEAEAARITERGNGFDHPVLGRIHPAHLPLPLIEAEMPRTWAALSGARSFGLTRPPRARFISALLQRLKEFKDAGAIRADDPQVAEEAARVCEWLDGRGPFTDIEYIHFARQTDYADSGGRRVLTQLFPVTATDALSRWIAAEAGLEIEITEYHSRRQPKRWAKAIQPVARFAARNMMPEGVRRALHPLWTGSRLFDNAAKGYGVVAFDDDVERFVDEHYAVDATLHAEAEKNAARLAESPAGGEGAA
jgi:hypothetical protein